MKDLLLCSVVLVEHCANWNLITCYSKSLERGNVLLKWDIKPGC